MKEIEITDFQLKYDGMYSIHWDKLSYRVYLTPAIFLKMLKIEGYNSESIIENYQDYMLIEFKKVKLIVWGEVRNGTLNVKTSIASDNYFHFSKKLNMIDVELKELS